MREPRIKLCLAPWAEPDFSLRRSNKYNTGDYNAAFDDISRK